MHEEEGLRPIFPVYDLAPQPQQPVCARYIGCETVARLRSASRQPQGMAALAAMCEQFPGFNSIGFTIVCRRACRPGTRCDWAFTNEKMCYLCGSVNLAK